MGTYRDYRQDLARNLIVTLGTRHAIHAAEQFGWYGVAQAVADMRNEALASAAPAARLISTPIKGTAGAV